MPMEYEMNKFITVPNTDHVPATGVLELLPAAHTWINELLSAHNHLKKKYNGQRPLINSIEDRNAASVELMSVAAIFSLNAFSSFPRSRQTSILLYTFTLKKNIGGKLKSVVTKRG